jgi:hypothetical protein
MEKSWSGDAGLDVDDGEVVTIYGGGGRRPLVEEVPLSEVIQRINERFGTHISDTDRLFVDQVADDIVGSERVQVQALANDEQAFGVGFDKTWLGALTDRLSANRTSPSNSSTTRNCEPQVFWWRTPVSTDAIENEREREYLIARRWSP